MKEIEKIYKITTALGALSSETGRDLVEKMNEVIEVVNALIITHPKLEDSAKLRRDFKELQDESK